ncbi:hypothetical protein [Desulfosporosinus acididurans]|uniref:hypothetical protein n=1 Tax=Desulfosporosinus acididurans TaxID=476652 RepID=UPI000A4BD965|nr:hypothetical protein [Desulfosporosinus acididurans]
MDIIVSEAPVFSFAERVHLVKKQLKILIEKFTALRKRINKSVDIVKEEVVL